jgi:hypothetical protein
MMEDVNHDGEGHRLYAEQGARELAYFELGDGDHDLLERIVIGTGVKTVGNASPWSSSS